MSTRKPSDSRRVPPHQNCMVDEKALKHALVSFRCFRSHVFGSITEAMVEEYHTILIALQEASDKDLTAFLIPRSRMRPHIVAEARQSRSILSSRFEPSSRLRRIATKISSWNDWSGSRSVSRTLNDCCWWC
jgi:hypothetical protein